MLGLGRIAYTQSKWDDSEDLVRQALDFASKRESKTGMLTLRAMLRYRRGMYEACIQDAKKVIQISPESFEAGLAHSSIGIVHNAYKQDSEAQAHWTQALALAIALKSPELAVRVHNNKGAFYYDRKQYETAKHHFKQAIDIAISANFEIYLGFPYLNQAGNYLATDEKDNALKALEEAKLLFEKVGNVMMLGAVNIELGRMHRQSRNHKKAQTHLARALELCRDGGAHRFLVFTYRELGILHSDQRLWSDAILYFKLALELAMILKDQVQQVDIERYLNECIEKRDSTA